ncbi:putative leader peptide [Micromonospora sp. NPDC050686]|uniref:putative leader peptide n=1 Tax=Micromonospora sp. NPDC050686 TaxID=3154631 RepID=UPI0033E96D0D
MTWWNGWLRPDRRARAGHPMRRRSEPVDTASRLDEDLVVRSAYLTKRGHIDLLRVASAACRPCV